MKTTKPIATISFNSSDFLRIKLQELLDAKIVSFWCYISHLPEDDEGGLKEHFHVYIEPSKLLQTDDLREFLKEFDPSMPNKPKGCLKFVFSKFGDWFMYALHDKRYLTSKGQSRRYHYRQDDIVASSYDDLTYMVRSIDLTELSPWEYMLQAQKNGLSWEEYALTGQVPIQQLHYFRDAWYMLIDAGRTFRANKDGHALTVPDDVAVDVETGEIIE